MDRGKKGSKIHLITERTGLPMSVGISGANLHGDKGYDYASRERAGPWW